MIREKEGEKAALTFVCKRERRYRKSGGLGVVGTTAVERERTHLFVGIKKMVLVYLCINTRHQRGQRFWPFSGRKVQKSGSLEG